MPTFSTGSCLLENSRRLEDKKRVGAVLDLGPLATSGVARRGVTGTPKLLENAMLRVKVLQKRSIIGY